MALGWLVPLTQLHVQPMHDVLLMYQMMASWWWQGNIPGFATRGVALICVPSLHTCLSARPFSRPSKAKARPHTHTHPASRQIHSLDGSRLAQLATCFGGGLGTIMVKGKRGNLYDDDDYDDGYDDDGYDYDDEDVPQQPAKQVHHLQHWLCWCRILSGTVRSDVVVCWAVPPDPTPHPHPPLWRPPPTLCAMRQLCVPCGNSVHIDSNINRILLVLRTPLPTLHWVVACRDRPLL